MSISCGMEVKQYSDIGHSLFSKKRKSTCDIEKNKQQGFAALLFLQINMRHWKPPSNALIDWWSVVKGMLEVGDGARGEQPVSALNLFHLTHNT